MAAISLNLAFVVITAIVFIVAALTMWNIFAPDASRAAYTGIFGPGGLFGLVLFGRRKKGMETELMLVVLGIIAAITVIILMMPGFFEGAGPASSSIENNFMDFVTRRLS